MCLLISSCKAALGRSVLGRLCLPTLPWLSFDPNSKLYNTVLAVSVLLLESRTVGNQPQTFDIAAA